MSEHTFCRIHMGVVRQIVNKLVDVKIRKQAWAYNHGRDSVEFQIPGVDFYWHGSGCCLWEAKARGWEAYLEQYHKADYDRLSEEMFEEEML